METCTELFDIPDYPEYKIDRDGNVYSLPRRYTSKHLRVIKYTIHQGYKCVYLCSNNKVKTHKLHRIIAQVFIPNPDNKPQVNHINGIKTDNRIENLEWVTSSENIRHAHGLGLSNHPSGHNSLLSKLTEEERKSIVKMYALREYSQKELAELYSVSQSNIVLVIRQYLREHFNLIESGEAIDVTTLETNPYKL